MADDMSDLDDLIDITGDCNIYDMLNYEPPPSMPVLPLNIEQVDYEEKVTGETIDPMDDPYIRGLFDEDVSANMPSGSRTKERITNQNGTYLVLDEFPFFPVPAAPVSCCFCQILRDMIHTNGMESTKFEIHGRVGMITHAILTIQTSDKQMHHMLDLSEKNFEGVKEFLVEFCEFQKRSGFVLLQEPMAPFYEAVCAGLDLSDNYLVSDDKFEPSSGVMDGHQAELDSSQVRETSNEQYHLQGHLNEHCQPESEGSQFRPTSLNQYSQPVPALNHQADVDAANQAGSSVPKTKYQLQRERAARLTVGEVSGYFHLNLTAAAKQLGLCATVVKRFCRRHGCPRWPYRRIAGNERKISDLKQLLQGTICVSQQLAIEAQIAMLQHETYDIYSRFVAS